MKANNAEAPDSSNAADTLKWVATFVLLVAAVVGNYLYGELSVVARAAGVIVLIAAALGVAATTTKAKKRSFCSRISHGSSQSSLANTPRNYANHADRFSSKYCNGSGALGY